jgi:periplasmic protein TonB
MAMFASLRREERIGLAVAAGLHAALVLAFLLQPETREDIEPAQRMTVNLASEVGLEAAAPEPVAESRAAIAPTLSDEPAPAPQPTPQPRLERPVAASTPAPADARPRRRPDRTPAKPASQGGGSRVGDNFLTGMGDSTKTSETRAPAAALGASDRASLLQGIVREVKPHWQPPSGPDVDRLVSKIRFRLNPDGGLAGRPVLVGQRGETASNRAQAGRHGEQAIRAVQLAAPFDLPERYYSAWKTVTLDFDWKLAQ